MVAVYELIPPPQAFAIDLQGVVDDQAANMGVVERIQNVTLPAFLEYGKIFLTSAGEAFWTNVSYIPETFRAMFVDYGCPGTGEEIVWRLGLWALLHLIGFVTVTAFVFWKNICAMPAQLLNYVDAQMNPKHIRTKEAAIDISHVPDGVTVQTLLQVFDEINFADENAPGYMNALSRTEGAAVYAPATLRRFLNDNFIRRVQTREAFLGTPPAWNIAQLHQFYDQIERAVRFSLHKVIADFDTFVAEHPDFEGLPQLEADYNAFMDAHGGQPVDEDHEDYEEYAKQLSGHQNYVKYNDLLQAKARVAIDLAIAGNHCGGRYMGDSMDIYFFCKGEVLGETLEDDIMNVLAKKREKIARSHIERYLGQNVHDFSAYMANLGGLLAIPGTEHVIEQLGGLHDRDGLLQHFFEEYTPAAVREAVQEKFGRSQTFRERVYEWLKANSQDWNREASEQQGRGILAEVAALQPQSQAAMTDQVGNFKAIVVALRDQGILTGNAQNLQLDGAALLDLHREWTEFLRTLVTDPQARAVVDAQIGNTQDAASQSLQSANKPINAMSIRVEMATRREHWKSFLAHPLLAPVFQEVLTKAIQEDETDVDMIPFQTLDWASQVNSLLQKRNVPPLTLDTLVRCCRGEADFEQVIAAHLENQRATEFLEALEPQREKANVLNRELLEWLLVAHKVLNPPATAEQRVVPFDAYV